MSYIYTSAHDPDFIDFMLDRVNLDLRGQNLDGPNWFCVTIREQVSERVVGGVACEFKTSFDAHISVALDDPEAVTRRLLNGIFRALFTKAHRITALCDPDNYEAEDRLKRLGFIYEGFLRLGLDGHHDALVYGMIAEDCRFLPGVRAAQPIGEGRWSASPKAPTHTIQRPRNNRLI